MNIGITTFQWANNYGAVLQAYALQTFLSERGHLVEVVDYRPLANMPIFKKFFSKKLTGCINKWEMVYKCSLFESFRKDYLNRTPAVFHVIKDLDSIADRFDILITGSDQVWNPQWLSEIEGLFDFYFLSFAGQKTKRISYAASFGHSEKETMNEQWQKIISEKLKGFNAISVRELSGVDLVRQLCGRTDAEQVVDPTLLLDSLKYEKIASKNSKKRKYLFCYMLHGLDKDAEEIRKKIAEQFDLTVLKCDANKTGLHFGYNLPSPVDWLRYIRNASFMVTNSFHGVVFCLLFHIPFVAIMINGQIGSMNCRIIELLNTVGLANRIVFLDKEPLKEICTEQIDWDKVYKTVADMRIRSIDFLTRQGL
jgi:polysaccharide pyruvyl transferase WcaK-like protein